MDIQYGRDGVHISPPRTLMSYTEHNILTILFWPTLKGKHDLVIHVTSIFYISSVQDSNLLQSNQVVKISEVKRTFIITRNGL